LVLLLIVSAAVIYQLVLRFDNSEHDRALAADARAVATLLSRDGMLSEQASYLLSYDTEGSNYFVVQSNLRGVMRSTGIYVPPYMHAAAGEAPHFFDARIVGQDVRAVTLSIPSLREPGEIFTVTLAESLDSRVRLANEMLLITLVLHGVLIACLIGLTTVGVWLGLRSLQPLLNRLVSRGQSLEPLSDTLVPREVLPLTRTIDSLFSRLRTGMEVHENFVADAAHQLRTPLAGLRLHSEQALATEDLPAIRKSLEQIHLLTLRASRTANQLLSLLRAQSPLDSEDAHQPLDLTALVRDAVSEWVAVGLRAGIDFGFQGPADPIMINGSEAALRDLLDNLLDNAKTYSEPGTSVTVSLSTEADHSICLVVADDGRGVPAECLGRLGERFYRVPGSKSSGTGLGLAIVTRVAARHSARLVFGPGITGGFRVYLRFPPQKSVVSNPSAAAPILAAVSAS
jgi:two-component system sensor histidine kinase TctE